MKETYYKDFLIYLQMDKCHYMNIWSNMQQDMPDNESLLPIGIDSHLSIYGPVRYLTGSYTDTNKTDFPQEYRNQFLGCLYCKCFYPE